MGRREEVGGEIRRKRTTECGFGLAQFYFGESRLDGGVITQRKDGSELFEKIGWQGSGRLHARRIAADRRSGDFLV